MIEVEIDNYRHTILKKKIAGFITLSSGERTDFSYDEQGVFKKSRKLLIDGTIVAQSDGINGSIIIEDKEEALFLSNKLFEGICVSSLFKEDEISIDSFELNKPSLEGRSDVVFYNGKKTIFHLWLKKSCLFECFSKLDIKKEVDTLEENVFPLVLFFLCCKASNSSDGFSGADGF